MEQEKFKLKKVKYVNKTFRFPIDFVKALDAVAQREKISMTALIMQCCEFALDKLEADENKK